MRLTLFSPCVLALLTTASAQSIEVGSPDEFRAAAAKLQPGDSLVVRDGVYRNWRVRVQAKGAKGAAITVRPAHEGRVLFRRDTRIRLDGEYLVLSGFHFNHAGPGSVVAVTGSRNRVTDCRFLHCGNPTSTYSHIVTIGSNSHHNRVDHCYWEGSKSMSVGIRLRDGETASLRNRIDHNVFRDIIRLWNNGQEAVQIGQGGPSDQVPMYTLVECNTFDNASGDAEFISNKSSNNTYRYNVAANCRAMLVLRGGNECLVAGNVLVRSSGGIRVHGCRHTIIDNVLAHNSGYGIMMPKGGKGHRQPEGCLVAGNLFVDNRRAGLAFANMAKYTLLPKGNTIAFNHFQSTIGTLLDQNAATDNQVVGNVFSARREAKAGFLGEHATVLDKPLVDTASMQTLAGLWDKMRQESARKPALAEWLAQARPAVRAVAPGSDAGQSLHVTPKDLPPVPAKREPFDADALKGEPLFAWQKADPLANLAKAAGDAVARHGSVTLTNAAVWLPQELPESFVAEWEYSPAALDSRGRVAFAAADREGGYSLLFGGKSGSRPRGIVELTKGRPDNVVADGHDTVLWTRDSARPGPKLWYGCQLVKRGGALRFSLRRRGGHTPVVVWDDRGIVDGPAFGSGTFGLVQVGQGQWRNLRVWACKP